MTYTSSLPTSPAHSEKPQVAPAKVLQKVITKERSGRLTITDCQDSSISWRVYLGGGQIHYAESTMGQVERLTYLLSKHLPDFQLPKQAQGQTSTYSLLCKYWQTKNLPLNYFRKLLALLTQEALVQFLAIPQGFLDFEVKIGLDPLLLSAPFRQLIMPIKDQIPQWSQMRPAILSPFQKPLIHDSDQFLKVIWQETNHSRQLQEMTHLLQGEASLYQLADQLKIDVLALAHSLYPLVQAGAVEMSTYQEIQKSLRPAIACVDDSQTIQQFVKFSLEAEGFEVFQIMDPMQALSILIEQRPKLILMDIEMPKMDGYELCRMVRQVDLLKNIPVVMLTGREGIIDRMRARMSGCTAYLTKPFNPQELLELVQKLTSSAEVLSQI
ncbi:MAG: response regulator [Acaryochloridaceae cyanobacterium CSU_5_19]|nr:response regulator [Acaryochloridaceae cyanobacterium CSU_5_19]